ncbi:MAG: F0F1 ATP synthase subunit gamma, partial [SAR324 cluster bacterium]|nr:F0F1 ATP synthase subunit gamma [SAR324 cluster bacterium]
MPGLRDIKRRLQTVRNIRKITYAMKLVSTAKLKKAQESVVNTREYTSALRQLIQELRSHALSSKEKFSHPLMEQREDKKKVCIVVIGGSRGLCGGYNTNLNKKVEAVIEEFTKDHPSLVIDFIVLGKKPSEHFRRVRREAKQSYEVLSEDPYSWPIEEVSALLEVGYTSKDYDEVYMIY